MVKASAKDALVAETEEVVEEAEETVEAVIVVATAATWAKIIKTQLAASLKVMEIKAKKDAETAVDVAEAKENLADKKSQRPKIRGQTLVGTDAGVEALRVIVLQLIVVMVLMVEEEAKVVGEAEVIQIVNSQMVEVVQVVPTQEM